DLRRRGRGGRVGQGGQHLAELERSQGLAQVRGHRIAHGGGGHRGRSVPPGMRVSWVARYSAGSRANRAVAATGGRGGEGVFSVGRSSTEGVLWSVSTSTSMAPGRALSSARG